MLTINSLNDTPVRRDDYPVTKSCLLYRPKQKGTSEKVNRKCIEENSVDQISKGPMSFSCKVMDSVHPDLKYVDEDSKTDDNDLSVITVGATTSSTSCSSHKYFSEDECMMSIVKLSTPAYVEVQAKAVSSTPNQEILNTSKLKRNVASQTTLTLNAREFNEYNEGIKSYIIEVPEKNSISVQAVSEMSQCNMDITSPLRSLCTSKIIHCNTPVGQKTTNTRKLSLRSKTMITSAFERSKDTFPRYKSLEEKRLISNTFSLLPRPQTPPSCTEKVTHNPFEMDLSERLGKSIFSPNVFENVLSPSEDSDSIRWTIEDMSSINPVPIEEDFTLPSDDEDPEKESQVQQEIERYFSETHSVLSPDDLSQQVRSKNQHKRAAASTPQKATVVIYKEFSCANTQTDLSLPEVLPYETECTLKIFFKVFEMDDFNISASNLRRKLFFHSEDEPPSPVRYEMNSSPMSRDSFDLDHSPFAAHRNGRHFTPLANRGAFSSPEMSPVVPQSAHTKPTCKKTLNHYFSGNQVQAEKESDGLIIGAIKNSTVIMNSLNEMLVDSESSSSAMPSSQDTGYITEESWQQGHPFSIMASTPTRRTD